MKRKRGRPAKQGVDRTASGRISRAQPREDMRLVAISAREAHTGLPKELAVHEKAETSLGRLWLRGLITGAMREAGEHYARLYGDMLTAIKAPTGLAVGGGKSADGDLITDDYTRWARQVIRAYSEAHGWLIDIGGGAATMWIAVGDYECSERILPHLCRELLVLARKWGFDDGAKLA